MAISTLYLRQLVSCNEVAEESGGSGGDQTPSFRRSCIWGVPALENTVDQSAYPGMLERRVDRM